MSSLDRFAAAKLVQLDSQSLRRVLTDTARSAGSRARRAGRELTSFCCNDYLDLTQHPKVKAAAAAALEEFGAGSGASRLVTGNHPLNAALEDRLARIKGSEAACVFGSGYLANIGVPPVVCGEGDLILIDELAHASMHAGAKLSDAETVRFPHNDLKFCRALLRDKRARHGHCLVMTEGVFSMDGDRAPLRALADLAREFDAWLLCDDAHGLGVLGGGRGTAFESDPVPEIPLQIGTLSKAVGAYGGFLCASKPVIDLVKTRSRSLVYSTGLPPSVLAAALAALDVIASDHDLVARPLANARLFTSQLNLPQAESPVVPLIVGDPKTTLAASRALEADGFLVTAIRPPTVPDGTARLRFTFTAAHREDDIRRLAGSVRQIGLAA